MQKKIMVMMLSLLFAVPVVSSAEVKETGLDTSADYKQVNENIKFKHDESVGIHKANKEMKAKRRAEKEAVKAKKRAKKAQDKAARIAKKQGANPSKTAYEQNQENAKFKRDEAVFNNKANTKIRAKKEAKREVADEVEAKKKVEEAQDKGEGQVKVKF